MHKCLEVFLHNTFSYQTEIMKSQSRMISMLQQKSV